MGTVFTPKYLLFSDYQENILEPQPQIQQLALLDDEILNIEYINRYQNELDKNEWDHLESYYNSLFTEFVTERIQAATQFDDSRVAEAEFAEFRKQISHLNKRLPFMPGRSVTTISKPAERLLIKELRKQRYDPSALDVSHISRGGSLYLLELFVTAGRQESTTGTDILETLLEEVAKLDERDTETVRELLNAPVLIVSLWENQQAGPDAWLDSDREGILETATATGKTVIGIGAIAELCGDIPERPDQTPRTDDADIMIVAHSNAILSQWATEIAEKLGFSASTLTGSGQPDAVSFSAGEIEFKTAHSLLERYDPDLKDNYDLIIYDEVHHYSNTDGFGAAIQRPNYDAALGLSATVGDENDAKRKTIEDILAPVIFNYDIKTATRDGIIPDFEWTVHLARLSPQENSDWKEASHAITSTFSEIKGTKQTRDVLEGLTVPFTRLEDLGDFIQAYQAAQLEFDEVPDDWEQLQGLIQSRNWIRHRSQPKSSAGIELAKAYLENAEKGPKIVMFTMDIDTTEEIADELSESCENIFVVHSKIAASSGKKDRLVHQRINKFDNVDRGVLIAPQLLDEGIDVPDAQVGISVAGTKTKLQLVQRMGRVLRRHGDQRPHFHHFIAVPHEHEVRGLDEKQYVQQLNWVRELGEAIGEQPTIKDAEVDMDVVERADQRGNELRARDLLADLEIETVEGSIRLEQLIEEINPTAARILKETLNLDGNSVSKSDWEAAMDTAREDSATTIETLQRIWWLFPLYREEPDELAELLTGIINQHPEADHEEDDDNGDDQENIPTGPESPEIDGETKTKDGDQTENETQQDEESTSGDEGLFNRIKSKLR